MSKARRLRIVAGRWPEHLLTVRELFLEYARSLEIDLCFQNFEQELAELPGRYAPPAGALFLAKAGAAFAGCVALRPLATRDNRCKGADGRSKMDADSASEMKRLYVRPAYRGLGVGRALAQRIIEEARQLGYDRMVLDTLAGMKEAIALYESLGFHYRAPYYHNPDPCAVFMELELKSLGP